MLRCCRFEFNLREIQNSIIDRILTDTEKILKPFVAFDEARGHEVMATFLDPRFSLGDIFVMVWEDIDADSREGGRATRRDMREYDENVMMPTLTSLAITIEDEKRAEAVYFAARAGEGRLAKTVSRIPRSAEWPYVTRRTIMTRMRTSEISNLAAKP
jgi:hypothetical protein